MGFKVLFAAAGEERLMLLGGGVGILGEEAVVLGFVVVFIVGFFV